MTAEKNRNTPKSQVEGVYYERGRQKWVAAIWIKGKKIKRRFDSKLEAEKARRTAEVNKEYVLSIIHKNNIQQWEDFVRKNLLTANGGYREMNMSLNDIGKDNGYGEKTLNQMFQSQLVEVLKNIKNPMTDEGARQIQIIVDVKPENGRSDISISYALKTKLSPETAKSTTYDIETLEPSIMDKSIPGQVNMKQIEAEDAEYTEQE